jgi:hypothetical protein
MNVATLDVKPTSSGEIPPELVRLRDRIGELPARYRDALLPMADDAAEQALFRGRVLTLARDGLERYRLDLAIAQFDVEATRREQQALRRTLEALGNP